MRVNTRVVVDIGSGRVLERECYEYGGKVALAKGGGGGSGKISWPPYMMGFHANLLSHTVANTFAQVDKPDESFLDVFNARMKINPFTAMAAYDPRSDILQMTAALTAFKNINMEGLLTASKKGLMGEVGKTDVLDADINFSSFWDRIAALVDVRRLSMNTLSIGAISFSDITIANDINVAVFTVNDYFSYAVTYVAGTITLLDLGDVVEKAAKAFGAELDREIEGTVLPRFERGMQDINAVMSSAFVLGRAVIEEGRNKNVARFMAELKAGATIDGRRLDYENRNKLRELLQAENLDRRGLKMQEGTSYRDAGLRETMDRRGLGLQRDLEIKKLQAQEDMDKRTLMSAEAIDKRRLIYENEDSYRKLLVQQRLTETSMIGTLTPQLLDAHIKQMVSGGDLVLRVVNQYTEWYRLCATLSAEIMRYRIVSLKEEVDKNTLLDESEAKWKLDLFAYAGNLLAGPGGGVSTPTQKTSIGQSVLGGAIGGAGVGAAIVGAAGETGVIAGLALPGPGWVIGAGALIGGSLGLF